MNRIKNLITVIALIMLLGSSIVYATEAFNENETPFLPAFADDNKDEVSDTNQTDNSADKPVNSDGSTGGGGGSYKPSTKPADNTESEPTQLESAENNISVLSDIRQDDWFYSDVMFVFNNKIMTGTGESKFSPDTTLNRAMMVTILHRIDGDSSSSRGRRRG